MSLEYVQYIFGPWIARLEQSMIRSLLSDAEKGIYFVKFNVDGLLRGNYQSRMQGYAVARQNGWMSANDIRQLENLDMIPDEEGGNLYLINGSMTKLKDAGAFAKKGTEDGENEQKGEEQSEDENIAKESTRKQNNRKRQ